MLRCLISDVYEWINEIPTVPIYSTLKSKPRERAWVRKVGKEDSVELDDSTLTLWCVLIQR